MTTNTNVPNLYRERFRSKAERRKRIWAVLCADYFQALVDKPETDTVVDLGCGYGEFINHIEAKTRIAIDTNPDTKQFLHEGVTFIERPAQEIYAHVNQAQLIFSSNFLEHLQDKATVESVISSCFRALQEGGKLVLLGPNIRFLAGKYWDFWDHHVALSEKSLAEVLRAEGYKIRRLIPRFLPYTMSDERHPPPPPIFVKLYLLLNFLWPIFGRQFLIVAAKPLVDRSQSRA
jgi:dolichol-phosphate mannosyltransferase